MTYPLIILAIKNTIVIITFSKILTFISNNGYIINWIKKDVIKPITVLVTASNILFCLD